MTIDASDVAIARRFRIADAPTLLSRVVPRLPVTISRIRCDEFEHGLTRTPPIEDAYAAQILLKEVPRVGISLHGRRILTHPSPPGALYLFSFLSSPVIRFHVPFDFIRFYISLEAINDILVEGGGNRVRGLARPELGTVDPVLYQLALAALPALDAPGQASQLFIDYLALGFHAHLIATYSGDCRDLSCMVRGLAPWQARRVTEMIDASLDGHLSISSLAAECRLSASHFARAFVQTFGVPPHRWLLNRRVERAKELIYHAQLSLADVGLACGFTTQSHFSRVFAGITGTTPTHWRRMVGHASSALEDRTQ